MTENVLISGAGIAGPALAFWLLKHGFQLRQSASADSWRPCAARSVKRCASTWSGRRPSGTGWVVLDDDLGQHRRSREICAWSALAAPCGGRSA
jgi:hypothetical protein